tara:strand:- start:1581 stop:2021 length:441 start_codon:yes stop_codon:yes gene_type:complete
MWKWISIIIVAMLIPSIALASPAVNTGAFHRLLKGEKARFDGWCYDDFANAQILADIELKGAECQSLIQRELGIQKEGLTLEINKLKHRIRTESISNAQVLLIRDEQIAALEAAALKSPNDYSMWWVGGGFVAGILLSVGIVYAVK